PGPPGASPIPPPRHLWAGSRPGPARLQVREGGRSVAGEWSSAGRGGGSRVRQARPTRRGAPGPAARGDLERARELPGPAPRGAPPRGGPPGSEAERRRVEARPRGAWRPGAGSRSWVPERAERAAWGRRKPPHPAARSARVAREARPARRAATLRRAARWTGGGAAAR